MRDDKVPVSLKLLDLKLAEVKGEVTTHRLETKAEFVKIAGRFEALEQKIDSRFVAFDRKFEAIDLKFDNKFNEIMAQLNAKFESLHAAIYKNEAIIEEQNTRNRFALDGYTQVYEKQLETDARIARIEKYIFGS